MRIGGQWFQLVDMRAIVFACAAEHRKECGILKQQQAPRLIGPHSMKRVVHRVCERHRMQGDNARRLHQHLARTGKQTVKQCTWSDSVVQ